MRYATLPRVILGIPGQTLIWLSNDDPAASAVDEAVIEEIVGNAEDLIDDHLRGRYALPLVAVPSSVAVLAVKLARHDLYARRPETEVPKDVVREYEAALKTLSAIRDGKLTLGIKTTQEAQPEPGAAHVRAPNREFSDEVLAKY